MLVRFIYKHGLKMRFKILFTLMLSFIVYGQSLDWISISENYESLPKSVSLFRALREEPKLEIFYMDIDLNDDQIAVRSYLTSDGEILSQLSSEFGTIAAVNGGFFGGNYSYSAVVYPEGVKSTNVPAVTRNNKSYPVLRSLFSLDSTFTPAVNWIYHFDNSQAGIYAFDTPINYAYLDDTPQSIPDKSSGRALSVLTGIGGGPTLVKDSLVTITYNEEVMWGSGVGLANRDPRTAVGHTSDNHIIMVVADGRQDHSEGVSLTEMADIMRSLGCVAAMNLDGGGSTQMTVGDNYVNQPSEYRAIPSMLAVVHRDSLLKKNDDENAIYIDSEDESTEKIGEGWFETANAGFWGDSPALLHSIGTGDNEIRYYFAQQQKTEYRVYGWWVAANNRSSDTPYIIHHINGIDTIRVDQTANHARWNYLGTFTFGERNQYISVTDDAETGSYVVADGIKLVPTSPVSVAKAKTAVAFQLYANYPNPFNPSTTISFNLPKPMRINLAILDISGDVIEKPFDNQLLNTGHHAVNFYGQGLASGVYFYRLSTNYQQQLTRKMLLIK